MTYFGSNLSKSLTFVFLFISALLSGCSSQEIKPSQDQAQNKLSDIDPWEGFNRSMYGFNKQLDKAILKPATDVYTAITPDPVEQGVGNFFSNLSEVGSAVNNLLQGKVVDSVHVISRFIVNSTFGIGGIFDFASFAGMDKRPEDFGQTLGKWGVPAGPYVVLPFFGPKFVRGSAAIPVDNRFDILNEVIPNNRQTAAQVVKLLNVRKGLRSFEGLVFGDEYAFVRDAYLSRRQAQVYDGIANIRPPANKQEFDEFDEFD